MKQKLFFLFLISLIFLPSCATVKSLNDYDFETSEQKNYYDKNVLGTVSVSKVDVIWSSYHPDDEKTKVLFSKLLQKAKKQYGQNIELINISIGDNQPGITVPLYIMGGSGFFGCAIGSSAFTTEKETKTSSLEKKTETEVTNEGAFAACMAGAFVSLGAYFFKGVKATATVVSAEKQPVYELVSENEIESKLKLGKIAALKKKEVEQNAIRLANHEIWIGMSKNDLLISRGEPTRAEVKDDGFVSRSASLGVTAININSAAGISATESAAVIKRIQIYYYSDVQIYIANDTVTEIYDIKE
jgi:hypothetical protein